MSFCGEYMGRGYCTLASGHEGGHGTARREWGCTHRLGDRTGLVCQRTDPHETGHVYRSGHGSEVPDRHVEAQDPE